MKCGKAHRRKLHHEAQAFRKHRLGDVGADHCARNRVSSRKEYLQYAPALQAGLRGPMCVVFQNQSLLCAMELRTEGAETANDEGAVQRAEAAAVVLFC
jgi:hypothetical protein